MSVSTLKGRYPAPVWKVRTSGSTILTFHHFGILGFWKAGELETYRRRVHWTHVWGGPMHSRSVCGVHQAVRPTQRGSNSRCTTPHMHPADPQRPHTGSPVRKKKKKKVEISLSQNVSGRADGRVGSGYPLGYIRRKSLNDRLDEMKPCEWLSIGASSGTSWAPFICDLRSVSNLILTWRKSLVCSVALGFRDSNVMTPRPRLC